MKLPTFTVNNVPIINKPKIWTPTRLFCIIKNSPIVYNNKGKKLNTCKLEHSTLDNAYYKLTYIIIIKTLITTNANQDENPNEPKKKIDSPWDHNAIILPIIKVKLT